ncbi:hypothetical protein Amsp01_018320 [Amycolatopsis sp. NBRC 101858]|nr:hypothetical protein Amsp01_018320 [Amycolatopsis sp. NBRC 101858]
MQRAGRAAVDNRGVVDNCRPADSSRAGSVGGLWKDRARPRRTCGGKRGEYPRPKISRAEETMIGSGENGIEKGKRKASRRRREARTERLRGRPPPGGRDGGRRGFSPGGSD